MGLILMGFARLYTSALSSRRDASGERLGVCLCPPSACEQVRALVTRGGRTRDERITRRVGETRSSDPRSCPRNLGRACPPAKLRKLPSRSRSHRFLRERICSLRRGRPLGRRLDDSRRRFSTCKCRGPVARLEERKRLSLG